MVTEPAEGDDGGCFEPYIPPVSLPPTSKPVPKPEPKSLMHIIDKAIFGEDDSPTAGDTTWETEIPAPAAAEDGDDAEMAKPSEILTAPVEAPLPPPRTATAAELHSWIKRVLLARRHLAENAADLVAFWALSTLFQDALTILPCLVITGPAHDAGTFGTSCATSAGRRSCCLGSGGATWPHSCAAVRQSWSQNQLSTGGQPTYLAT